MSFGLSVVRTYGRKLKTNNSLRYIKKISDFSAYISMCGA